MDPMGKNLWDVMGCRNHLFWVWCLHRRGRWILRVEMIHERPSLTQNFDMPFDWLVESGWMLGASNCLNLIYFPLITKNDNTPAYSGMKGMNIYIRSKGVKVDRATDRS